MVEELLLYENEVPPKKCHTFGKFSCSDKHIHDSLDKSVYFWWLNRLTTIFDG